MATEVKERIAADLQKAKEEGSLRTDRIREIVRAAVSQAAGELKAGSGEIRTIAKDAIAAVLDLVKEKGQAAKAEVTASVEGVVDGIRDSRQAQIANTQAQVNHLQTELDTQTQELEAEVDGALVAIATEAKQSSSEFKTLLGKIVDNIRDSKQFAAAKEQYEKVKTQLAVLDERLAERYGDRYEQVKQQLEKYWETAKVWYEQRRVEVETGATDPVQRSQTDLGSKFADAGTFVARKEQEIKARIKDALHSEGH
ncbi:MAG: histidine kinase [Oscillatoriales cyanobacterium C42_A2020_001]|nr:histidine kinase [Leptolyngbyaceae cyanobacterium C42_A2020_001]